MQSQFASLNEFLAMGGYAFFVWLAFAVSLLAMFLLLLHTILVTRSIKLTVHKEQQRAIRILQARERRRQKKAQTAP